MKKFIPIITVLIITTTLFSSFVNSIESTPEGMVVIPGGTSRIGSNEVFEQVDQVMKR